MSYCNKIIVYTAIPIITTPKTKEAYSITEGDNITCTATGYPPPSVVWLNNDGSVVDENRLVEPKMVTNVGNIPSVSVSMIVRRGDDGVYTCVANNSIDNDTTTINITVKCKRLLLKLSCVMIIKMICFRHIITSLTWHHFSVAKMIPMQNQAMWL